MPHCAKTCCTGSGQSQDLGFEEGDVGEVVDFENEESVSDFWTTRIMREKEKPQHKVQEKEIPCLNAENCER